MEPNLNPPTAIWSATLKYGFVGCIRDLVINGASIDIVGYAHEQNSGAVFDSAFLNQEKYWHDSQNGTKFRFNSLLLSHDATELSRQTVHARRVLHGGMEQAHL